MQNENVKSKIIDLVVSVYNLMVKRIYININFVNFEPYFYF